jgi:RHS repeat-associated protein
LESLMTGAGKATIQYGIGPSLDHGPIFEIFFAEAFGTGLLGRGYGNGVYYMDGDLTDFDGDGYTDVVGNDRQFGFDPAQPAPGLLTTISSGRDATTEIVYTPRTNSKVVYCPAPTCRGGSMMPRWVVSSVSLSTAGRSAPAVSTYRYQNPVVTPDEVGQHAFRGFTRVDVTGPSTGTARATTINDYDHSQDYRGLLRMTRTVDEGEQVHSVTTRTWTSKAIGDAFPLPVFVPDTDRTWTCALRVGTLESRTEACKEYDTSIETVRTWAPLTVNAPVVSAWVETEVRRAEAIGTWRTKHRGTRAAYTLISDAAQYLLLPTEESAYEIVGGQEQLRSKQILEYEPGGLGLPRRLKTWLDGTEFAISATSVDPQTGLVQWEQKPEQYRQAPNAQDAERVKQRHFYDDFQAYVEVTENEFGHQTRVTRDRGTGVVVETWGPNSWQPPGCSACPSTLQGSRVAIDGFGRVERTWVSDFTPLTGYQLRLSSTTAYSDPTGTWPSVEIVDYQTLDDQTNATRQRIEIDATGLVISETTLGQGGGGDIPTSFEYTPSGAMMLARGPDPSDDIGTVEQRWEYDALGRETRAIRSDGTGLTTSYNLFTVTTAEFGIGPDPGPLATSHFVRDVFGNLVTVKEQTPDVGLATTTYTYDALGRMTAMSDADGITTAMTHDGAGQRRTITRGSRTWTYSYDHNGNPTAVVAPFAPGDDPLSQTASVAYDDLDRPLSRVQGARDLTATELATYGDGSASWEYDTAMNGVGRVAATTIATGGDGVLRRSFAYDGRGNIATEQVEFEVWNGQFADTRTVTRRYGAQNQLVFVEHADALGAAPATEIETRRDARGLPSQARWVNRPGTQPPPGGSTPEEVDLQRIAMLEHNRSGRRIKRYAPSLNHRQSWQYDQLGRPTSQLVEAKNSGGAWFTVASHAMTYFSADDLGTLSIDVAAGGGARSEQWVFDYDDRHQLTAASNGAEEALIGYTPGGRISTFYADYDGGPDHDYTYLYGDGWDSDAETIDQIVDAYSETTFDFTWDRAGNLRGRNGWFASTYRYDGADDLREARTGIGGAATRELYWYEANGQRVLALTTDITGVATGLKLWLGETEIHYAPNGSVAETQVYVDLDGPVARIRNRSVVDYTFAGHRHDLVAVIDDAGTPVAAFTYTPWGESTRTLGGEAANHRRRFNGKESDHASGLSYYGYRYYDPKLRIWTQADPLYRFTPDRAWTEPRRANLYTFAANNPIRFYDPDGRDTDAMGWHRFEAEPTSTGYLVVDWDIAGRVIDGTFGYIEIKAGAAMCTTGWGCIAGAFVAGDGADRVNSAVTGSERVVPKVIAKAAEAAGLDPDNAVAAYEGAMGAVTMRPANLAATPAQVLDIPGVKNVWAMKPLKRGLILEALLGTNLPFTFPVIDRFINGVATSIKSVNLHSKSYQAASGLKSVLKKYIDELAAFNGAKHAGTVVEGADIARRVLEVAVPAGGGSAAQAAALNEMFLYAASKGVILVLIPM